MAYATVEDMELLPSFSQMCDLTEKELETLLERGENYIHRYTRKTFYDETDPVVLEQLKWANILLAEYLWIFDDFTLKEASMLGMQGEKIGNYSYTIKDTGAVAVGSSTGSAELDSILDWLKGESTKGFNYFGVNGPSRRPRPHLGHGEKRLGSI